MATTPLTAIDTRVDMFQRGFAMQPRDTFFSFKPPQPREYPPQGERPLSSATIFDTDFEDDVSDVEDFEQFEDQQHPRYMKDFEDQQHPQYIEDFEDEQRPQYVEDIQYASDVDEDTNSPRLSYRSAGQTSQTTLSSYEEVFTPTSATHEFQSFNFDLDVKKPVEGPRGPHLFRSSVSSSLDIPNQYVLEMSPLTPNPSTLSPQYPVGPPTPISPDTPTRREGHKLSLLTESIAHLSLSEVPQWTPRQVSRWMLDAGFEMSIVEKFQENDISGAILTTLKFEDLRELGIQSFGQRTKVWNEIHILRGSAPNTPKPITPIDEASPVDLRGSRNKAERGRGSCESSQERGHSRRRKRSKSRRNKHETVLPLESISIVGIEQLMPKAHKCSKGENCSKWRKQQRLIAAFNKDHPVSPEEGGTVLIAGDPGNALTARPVSDAVPSVVASSDVLGPGATPALRYLEEESLRNVGLRDPQDNVKQFIRFQHLAPNQSSEEPPTPPYEMFPPAVKGPIAGLRGLPKLAIPPPRPDLPIRSQSAASYGPCSATAVPDSAVPFSPYHMDRAEALSPDLRNSVSAEFRNFNASPSVYRLGTPFSEMDVPVTAVPMSPVSREISQSVPPNMSYRPHTTSATLQIGSTIQRSLSRISARRPSLQTLPRVDEHKPVQTHPTQPMTIPTITTTSAPSTSIPEAKHARTFPEATNNPHKEPLNLTSPTAQLNSHIRHYSQTDPWAQFSTSVPNNNSNNPMNNNSPPSPNPAGHHLNNDISYAGWMKKRKTKMLRHEWHEHHFTLQGTRLAMHKDARAMDVLEYIDVDDYAIACSSLASHSKLNAAFKKVNISLGKDKKANGDVFSFQLIPQAIEKGNRLRKRESGLGGFLGGGEGKEKAGALGKTHYFAVRSRDERIDWMRELMLAKALKQKSEGYEVNVNGNMI